jgi:hypothetical protein
MRHLTAAHRAEYIRLIIALISSKHDPSPSKKHAYTQLENIRDWRMRFFI